MERQQERWLLEWLLVVSRVAVGALFVMAVGAAFRRRFDSWMRACSSFPLSSILPKKHNDVKIT